MGLAAGLCLQTLSAQEPLKVLVFGNSYSHCIIEELPEFAKAAGERPVEVLCLRVGGLDKHWKAIEAGEKDPQSPDSKVALETDYKAKICSAEEIKGKKWDVIVLQQFSSMSPDIKAWMPYAKNIFEYCKKSNPDARYVVYQTQAYRDDSIKFKGSANKNFRDPYSEDEMHQDIRNAVIAVAKELKIEVVPVGDAFQVARKSPLWGYTFPDPAFDYLNAVAPATPNEKNSLQIGFKWGTEVRKTGVAYQIDCHPNNLGRYIGGAVFYEVLFGKNVEDVNYVQESKKGGGGGKKKNKSDLDLDADKGLTPEGAAALRKCAHQAVEEFKKQYPELKP